MITNQELESQTFGSKDSSGTKLVEEGEIDAESKQAGLEHKLFYQRTEKQTAEQNYLQKIAEKKASLARAKAELTKKWWFIKSEHILVTTNCPICREQCLLHIDRPVCSACENKYELGGIEA